MPWLFAVAPYIDIMTTSNPTTPNSVPSPEEFAKMLETADKGTEAPKAVWQLRAEANPDKPYNGMDEDDMWEAGQKIVDELYEQNPHCVFTKMITVHLLKNIRQYAMERSREMFEQNEKAALAWAADVGWLSHAVYALECMDISCTGDDFIFNKATGKNSQ